jgi:hypothetical protein
LLPDTLVFHESPNDVRDIRCVEPGATVRVIVQFVGIRRSDGGWELDTAVTQVYIPPKKKEAVEAVEAVEEDRREEDRRESVEAVEADRREEVEAVEAGEEGKKEKAGTEEDGGTDKATQCASDEERREEERREEERAAETREMNEMLTTEVEQDVESFMI